MAEDQRGDTEEASGAQEVPGIGQNPETEQVQPPVPAPVVDAGTEQIQVPAQPSAVDAGTEQIQVPAQSPALDAVTEQVPLPAQPSAADAGTEQIQPPTQPVASDAGTEQVPLPTQPLAAAAGTQWVQPASQPPVSDVGTEQVPSPFQQPSPNAGAGQAPNPFQQPAPQAGLGQFPYPFQQPGANAGTGQFQPPFQQAGPYAGADQIQLPAPAQAPAPADRWRAAAVAVLNLSGLGLGYVLMRRWLPAALCWIATGILLIIALPAKPSGISGGILTVYLIVLLIAAVHGAIRGLRTPLTWPQRSTTAGALAVVLLIVPLGGAALYDQAHANAVQQMLLGELSQADNLVAVTSGESFSSAEPQYDEALATYRNLLENNRTSQAGQLVPNRLAKFYDAVAAPYAANDYCDAIAPLTYLRTLPGTFASGDLGSLATWPDGRLATSLYQCGVAALGSGGNSTATTDLSQLLSTFPTSAQAAKVEPAVAAAINNAAGGIGGSTPCTVTTTLKTLSSQSSGLSGGTAAESAALHKDTSTANGDVESGTYACGVSQYKSGDFTDAQSTMNNFVSTYPNDPNKALAQNYSIAAQVAQQEPAAGKVTPTLTSGGSVSVTIENDSPDAIQILYTGPATGSISIGACGSCTTYSSAADGEANACTNSSINYPQDTISLPPGTTYFLQQNTGSSGATPYATSEQYSDGDAYIDCAFETSVFGAGSAL